MWQHGGECGDIEVRESECGDREVRVVTWR